MIRLLRYGRRQWRRSRFDRDLARRAARDAGAADGGKTARRHDQSTPPVARPGWSSEASNPSRSRCATLSARGSPTIYGLPARDPATLPGAVAALLATAAIAAWMPARRVARADPAAVLRENY